MVKSECIVERTFAVGVPPEGPNTLSFRVGSKSVTVSMGDDITVESTEDGFALASFLESVASTIRANDFCDKLAVIPKPTVAVATPVVNKRKRRTKEEMALAKLALSEAKETKDADVKLFIGAYVDAFRERYGVKSKPDLRGVVQGQMKRFVTEVGLERASALVNAYLKMDDDWFKTKAYDFSTLLVNLNRVEVYMTTGSHSPSLGSRSRSHSNIDLALAQRDKILADMASALDAP